MRRTLSLLLLALACSATPTPGHAQSTILLTPESPKVMIGRAVMVRNDIWIDTVTMVGNVFYQGARDASRPDGPDMYLSFYFAGIWSEGPVTVRDLERTLMANFDDSVIVSIDAPANDPDGHYYVIAMPSTGPRTHHLTMMRVVQDGPNLVNFVLNVTYWGEPKDRNRLHELWLRDSSRYWAAELGRLKLNGRWRSAF
jgi:hypothetical protein